MLIAQEHVQPLPSSALSMVSLCLRLIIILKIKVPVDMLVMHIFINCVDLPSDFCYTCIMLVYYTYVVCRCRHRYVLMCTCMKVHDALLLAMTYLVIFLVVSGACV